MPMNDYHSERFGKRLHGDSDSGYTTMNNRPRNEDRTRRGGDYEIPISRNENEEYLTAREVPIRGRYNEGYNDNELPPPPPPPRDEEEDPYERLSIVDPIPPDLIMDSQNTSSRINRAQEYAPSSGTRGPGRDRRLNERFAQNNSQYTKNDSPRINKRPIPKPRRRPDGGPRGVGRSFSKRRNPDGSARRKSRNTQSVHSTSSSMFSYLNRHDDEGDDWCEDWDEDEDSEDGYDRLQDFIEEEDPDHINTSSEPDYMNSQAQSVSEPDYENQIELQRLESSHSEPTASWSNHSQLQISDNNEASDNLESELSKQLSVFEDARGSPKSDTLFERARAAYN